MKIKTYAGAHAFSAYIKWWSDRRPSLHVSAFGLGLVVSLSSRDDEWPSELGFYLCPSPGNETPGLGAWLWSWHDAMLVVSLGHNEGSWAEPWWRHPIFHPFRWIFGDNGYVTRNITTGPIVVEMPEGDYHGTHERYQAAWPRPRWLLPVKWYWCASASIDKGIPEPHKGRDDGLFGISMPRRDPAFWGPWSPYGVASEVACRVVEKRMRDGGPDWKPRDGWPAHCKARP